MPLMVSGDHGGTGDPFMRWTADMFAPALRASLPWLYALDPRVLSYTLLGLTLAVMAWAGRHFYTRAWAALRVMTQDGFPIYDQSATCPGAFVATCHSGVTLAANHALVLAPLIAGGGLPPETFDVFSARRFDVPAAA